MSGAVTDDADETDGGSTIRAGVAERDELRAAIGGIAGGTAGTAVMTLVRYGVDAVYGSELDVFGTLATLAAGESASVQFGFGLFGVAGSLAWPRLFVALGGYVPGGTLPRQGMSFALALWTGFVVAFGSYYSSLDLAVFVGISIATHLLYGWVLGFGMSRLSGGIERTEPLV